MSVSSPVALVRAFNRTVVERVGALQDSYLSGARPLGEARLLWEIGDGSDVRALRSRLGLDSGYLSRLLRSLKRAGLVVVAPAPSDLRIRTVRLTDAGRSERALLDVRSDDLARSLLDPLGVDQQERLLTAMSTVTELLTAAAVELDVVDPADPEAQGCLRAYFAELDRRFDGGFDAAEALRSDAEAMRAPRGVFLVATLRGEPVGCGGLRLPPGGVAELKRLWVSPAVRGLGLGRRLVRDLERRARGHGCSRIRLDSNASLTEAISLYRRLGYSEVAPFNSEPYADFWFEKPLTSPTSSA